MWILIAFVAAIGLTALAIMAVFGEFGSASSSQSAQSVVMGVSGIISSILTNYAANPNFKHLTTSSAIADGSVPPSWLPSGTASTSIVLPGGGAVAIAPASISPGTDNGFTVTLTGLNQTTCAQFGTFYTPNMSSLAIGTGSSPSVGATNPAYGTGSHWPPALANDCAAAGDNTVIMTFDGQ